MDPKPEQDLEHFIHGELRRLPGPAAPAELLARLQAELQRRASLPWWQRSWFSWPTPLRLCSALGFGGAAVLLCLAPSLIGGIGVVLETEFAHWFAQLAAASQAALTFADAMAALGQSVAMHPWVWVAAGVTGFSYLFSVGVGTLFVRFTWARSGAKGQL